MRHYSEAVKADVRRRMSPPNRQERGGGLSELGGSLCMDGVVRKLVQPSAVPQRHPIYDA